MHCVDLGESFQTHIFLQNLASIQPRTSPLKFAASRDGCVQLVLLNGAVLYESVLDAGAMVFEAMPPASTGITWTGYPPNSSPRMESVERERTSL